MKMKVTGPAAGIPGQRPGKEKLNFIKKPALTAKALGLPKSSAPKRRVQKVKNPY